MTLYVLDTDTLTLHQRGHAGSDSGVACRSQVDCVAGRSAGARTGGLNCGVEKRGGRKRRFHDGSISNTGSGWWRD